MPWENEKPVEKKKQGLKPRMSNGELLLISEDLDASTFIGEVNGKSARGFTMERR